MSDAPERSAIIPWCDLDARQVRCAAESGRALGRGVTSVVGHKPTFIPPPVIGRFTPQGCHRHLSVEAHDSIAWLAAMVPRRINITQFYGVFAPNGG